MSVGLLLLMLVTLTRVSRYARSSMLVWGATGGGVERFRSWDIDPSKLLMGLLFYVFAAAMLLRPQSRLLRVDLPLKLLLVFSAYTFLAVLWAYSPAFSLMWAVRFLQMIVVYLLVTALTSTRHDLHHWGHLFLYAPFLNLAGLIQEILAPVRHLGGAAGEVNVGWLTAYPCWAVFYLPFALHYLLWGRNRTETTLGGLALLVNLTTVYLSTRRAGPLAIALVLVLYFLLAGRRHRRFLPIVAMIVGGGVLAVILNPQYASRLGTIPWVGGATLEQWEGSRRLIQYMAGLELFRAHPIAGIGLGGARYWIQDVYGYREHLGQHSLFLQLASELGVIGLGLYALFLVAAFTRSFRAVSGCLSVGDTRGASLSAAMVCTLTAMVFWAQFQNHLFGLEMYLATALASVSCAIFVRRH